MTIWTRRNLEAKILALGGHLIAQRTWREGGDTIEELDYRVGKREVRLQEGIRDGVSVYLKENGDGLSPWRSIALVAHPEIETMTSEQKMDWIIQHPVLHDDLYLVSLVQFLEKFLDEN